MTNTIMFPIAPAIQSGAIQEDEFIKIKDIELKNYGDQQTAVVISFKKNVDIIKEWLLSKGINYKIV